MIMISVCLLVYRLYIKCHQVPSSDLFIKHPSLRLILSQAHDVRASKHAQMNRMRKEQIMKRYEKNEREIMQRESESVWGQIKRYLIKASTATTTRCAYVFPGLSLIYLILSISTYIYFFFRRFRHIPTYSSFSKVVKWWLRWVACAGAKGETSSHVLRYMARGATCSACNACNVKIDSIGVATHGCVATLGRCTSRIHEMFVELWY